MRQASVERSRTETGFALRAFFSLITRLPSAHKREKPATAYVGHLKTNKKRENP